jgi:hypothetical protein
MIIRTMRLADLKPAPYNPRKQLQPTDEEYKQIKASIEQFTLVEPLVYNERSGLLVGGHQRLTVLRDMGVQEVEVSVVDLPPDEERALNAALNKIKGAWNYDQLSEVMRTIRADLRPRTGFDGTEIAALLSRLDDAPLPGKKVHSLSKDFTRLVPDFGKFRIFHASINTQCNIIPGYDYLISYGACSGSMPSYPKNPGDLLFVDSGLLTGARKFGHSYTERQGDIVEYAKRAEADWCAMMDIVTIPPVLDALQITVEQGMEIHYRNAADFRKEHMPGIRKVFPIQGRTNEEYAECCQQMKRYIRSEDVVAVGGIAGGPNAQLDRVSEIIQIIRKAYPKNDLHLFGVSVPASIKEAFNLGATSCDSAVAGLNQLFGDLAWPHYNGEHYIVQRQSIKAADGCRISLGQKPYKALRHCNMAMVELAIYLEMGLLKSSGEPAAEVPQEEAGSDRY